MTNQWTIIWCHNDVICLSPEGPHEAQSLLSFSLPNQLQPMFLKKWKWLYKFISYSCLVACPLCHHTTPNIELHNNPNNYPKWVYHLPRQQLCGAAKVAGLKKIQWTWALMEREQSQHDGDLTLGRNFAFIVCQLLWCLPPFSQLHRLPPSFHIPHLSLSLVASSPSVSIIRIP